MRFGSQWRPKRGPGGGPGGPGGGPGGPGPVLDALGAAPTAPLCKFSPRRPPGQLQARLTQVSYVEFLGAPHCLVKNTVALQGG